MDVILLAALFLWIFRGAWLPFAISLPVVLIMGLWLLRMYHKNAAYICSECNSVFQPSVQEMLFSRHTPKTRKLKCTNCGHKKYCVEISNQEQSPT